MKRLVILLLVVVSFSCYSQSKYWIYWKKDRESAQTDNVVRINNLVAHADAIGHRLTISFNLARPADIKTAPNLSIRLYSPDGMEVFLQKLSSDLGVMAGSRPNNKVIIATTTNRSTNRRLTSGYIMFTALC